MIIRSNIGITKKNLIKSDWLSKKVLERYQLSGTYFYHGISVHYLKNQQTSFTQIITKHPVYVTLQLLSQKLYWKNHNLIAVNQKFFRTMIENQLEQSMQLLQSEYKEFYFYMKRLYKEVQNTEDKNYENQLQLFLSVQMKRMQGVSDADFSFEEKAFLNQMQNNHAKKTRQELNLQYDSLPQIEQIKNTKWEEMPILWKTFYDSVIIDDRHNGLLSENQTNLISFLNIFQEQTQEERANLKLYLRKNEHEIINTIKQNTEKTIVTLEENVNLETMLETNPLKLIDILYAYTYEIKEEQTFGKTKEQSAAFLEDLKTNQIVRKHTEVVFEKTMLQQTELYIGLYQFLEKVKKETAQLEKEKTVFGTLIPKETFSQAMNDSETFYAKIQTELVYQLQKNLTKEEQNELCISLEHPKLPVQSFETLNRELAKQIHESLLENFVKHHENKVLQTYMRKYEDAVQSLDGQMRTIQRWREEETVLKNKFSQLKENETQFFELVRQVYGKEETELDFVIPEFLNIVRKKESKHFLEQEKNELIYELQKNLTKEHQKNLFSYLETQNIRVQSFETLNREQAKQIHENLLENFLQHRENSSLQEYVKEYENVVQSLEQQVWQWESLIQKEQKNIISYLKKEKISAESLETLHEEYRNHFYEMLSKNFVKESEHELFDSFGSSYEYTVRLLERERKQIRQEREQNVLKKVFFQLKEKKSELFSVVDQTDSQEKIDFDIVWQEFFETIAANEKIQKSKQIQLETPGLIEPFNFSIEELVQKVRNQAIETQHAQNSLQRAEIENTHFLNLMESAYFSEQIQQALVYELQKNLTKEEQTNLLSYLQEQKLKFTSFETLELKQSKQIHEILLKNFTKDKENIVLQSYVKQYEQAVRYFAQAIEQIEQENEEIILKRAFLNLKKNKTHFLHFVRQAQTNEETQIDISWQDFFEIVHENQKEDEIPKNVFEKGMFEQNAVDVFVHKFLQEVREKTAEIKTTENVLKKRTSNEMLSENVYDFEHFDTNLEREFVFQWQKSLDKEEQTKLLSYFYDKKRSVDSFETLQKEQSEQIHKYILKDFTKDRENKVFRKYVRQYETAVYKLKKEILQIKNETETNVLNKMVSNWKETAILDSNISFEEQNIQEHVLKQLRQIFSGLESVSAVVEQEKKRMTQQQEFLPVLKSTTSSETSRMMFSEIRNFQKGLLIYVKNSSVEEKQQFYDAVLELKQLKQERKTAEKQHNTIEQSKETSSSLEMILNKEIQTADYEQLTKLVQVFLKRTSFENQQRFFSFTKEQTLQNITYQPRKRMISSFLEHAEITEKPYEFVQKKQELIQRIKTSSEKDLMQLFSYLSANRMLEKQQRQTQNVQEMRWLLYEQVKHLDREQMEHVYENVVQYLQTDEKESLQMQESVLTVHFDTNSDVMQTQSVVYREQETHRKNQKEIQEVVEQYLITEKNETNELLKTHKKTINQVNEQEEELEKVKEKLKEQTAVLEQLKEQQTLAVTNKDEIYKDVVKRMERQLHLERQRRGLD